MKKKKKNPQEVNKNMLTILGICILIIAIVGISFVTFNYDGSVKGASNGTMTISYMESDKVINLTNQLPVTDTTGKGFTNYFEFVITTNSTGRIKIPYEVSITPIKIEKINPQYACTSKIYNDKKTCESNSFAWQNITLGQDKLDEKQIKLYLTKKIDENNEEVILEPTRISNLEESKYSDLQGREGSLTLANIVDKYTGKEESKEKVSTYRLRMWIAGDTDSSIWNDDITYQYKFRVNIDSRLK